MQSSRSVCTLRRRAAFTMIELVIVVMILAIVAAAAAPAFINSLNYHRIEMAAHRVKTDLELARQTARLKSTTQVVTFTGSAYSMAGIKDFDDPTATYAVDLTDALYDVAATANFNNTQTVSFNGYGTPSNGGTVVIVANGRSITVNLDAVTGEVTIDPAQSVAPADGNGG
jgi:prepilin-type N-terminal cleavage/methylation domain-containing protein